MHETDESALVELLEVSENVFRHVKDRRVVLFPFLIEGCTDVSRVDAMKNTNVPPRSRLAGSNQFWAR